MPRITKFETTSFRIGQLEGQILYRILFASFIVLIAVFLAGIYGLLALIAFPVFTLRIQYDYLDEFILKKIRGITVPSIIPLNVVSEAYYEIFGINYGLADRQDETILNTWTSIIKSFPEDITIIRLPYHIPIKRFEKGREEYDSLFSSPNFYADAYFLIVEATRSEDVERVLRNYAVPFNRLSKEEIEILDDAF